MKYILSSDNYEIPKDVEVKIKSRRVEVKGPLGTVKRDFRHLPCEIFKD